MSRGVNPLRNNEFLDTVPGMTLAEQVRQRLRAEAQRKKLSQLDIADLLKWSQSSVARALTTSEITLTDLEGLCFALGISPVEAVRDHGLEFCADMTPSELRILEHVRQLPVNERDAFLLLLRVRTSTNAPERHAGPLTKRKASPRS